MIKGSFQESSLATRKSKGNNVASYLFLIMVAVSISIVSYPKNMNRPSLALKGNPFELKPFIPQLTVLLANDDGVPYALKINGQMWNVKKVPFFIENFSSEMGHVGGPSAMTYCDKRTIAYIDHENKMLLRTDLMHEVIHAGSCVHGGDTWWNNINPTRYKHPGVYHMADFISSFAHDNPDFMEWESVW